MQPKHDRAAILEGLKRHKPSEDRTTSAQVLRFLLAMRPNRVVTCEDVCGALGYKITAQAVSNTVAKLKRGRWGLPIVAHHGRGGGYILLVPVLTLGSERCANCASRGRDSKCSTLRGEAVDLNSWCRGWGRHE